MILGGMVLLHKDVESHERAWFLSVSEGAFRGGSVAAESTARVAVRPLKDSSLTLRTTPSCASAPRDMATNAG